ncbi:MAG: 5'-methylthioadenosine/S-adenosylhomocysteine nucleosidase [Bradyrhizobium sp.]
MPAKPRFDIGIVVPLAEEFGYVTEVAPIVRSVGAHGTFFHVLDLGPVKVIAYLVGGMGLLAAQHGTHKLLEYADVDLLVMLGTAGALDDDLSIGDVAVATEVNEFLANSKAESVEGGYEIRHSGNHWPLDYGMKQALANFEFASRPAYQRWQSGAAAVYAGLEILEKAAVCVPPPTLHRGNIASGNTVIASKAFADEVKRVDRKFIAIDMEAAGFAHAASERIKPVRHLVVRGISDRGDENKKKLDKTSKNGWRRYCVRNATTFLQALLSWDGFLECAGLADGRRETERAAAARDVIGALCDCPGGAWAAAVALGIYTHGPSIQSSGNVVPLDVTLLREIDPNFRALMEATEPELEPGFDQERVVRTITQAYGNYRRSIASAAAEAMIRDLDEVVTQIVFPGAGTSDQQASPVLIEADRIYEAQGAKGLVDYLGDRIAAGPDVRERFVEGLAELDRFPEIVAVVCSVPCADLTRIELENGMFACGRLGRQAPLGELWSRHSAEFNDAPATLLRQQVLRQFTHLLKIEK